MGARLCLGRGGGGELSLIEKVHLDGHPVDQDGVRAGNPGEARMSKQVVIGGKSGEIMSPGVAMALGIKDSRIIFIDQAILVHIGNVISADVSHLAIAAGKIPKKTIIDRGRADTGSRIIATAEQGELFIQQRIKLVLKGK